MDYAALKRSVPEHLKDAVVFQTAGTRPRGKLALGFGLAETVGQEAAGFTRGRVLLVTDRTIAGLGLHQVVLDSLNRAGLAADVFDKVEPEPHLEMAQRLEEIVRRTEYGLVVGLGGGSPMDMAKSAALAARNPRGIGDYMTGAAIENEGLPAILLPTTAGTGSEVSPFIVASLPDKKLFISSPYVLAAAALIDPLLTASLPPRVTAGTGLDALSHAVEGLVARPTPLSQAFARQSVELVFKYLERACREGLDLEARYYMCFASALGMLAYIQGGGLYAHSMSYILTFDLNLPHGLGCGVTLPYTLMFNIEQIEGLLAGLAPLVDSGIRGSESQKARQVVERFHGLLARVGVETSLKELGVRAESLDGYAEDLVKKYYRVRNPRPMSPEEVRQLVEAMWEGELREI